MNCDTATLEPGMGVDFYRHRPFGGLLRWESLYDEDLETTGYDYDDEDDDGDYDEDEDYDEEDDEDDDGD